MPLGDLSPMRCMCLGAARGKAALPARQTNAAAESHSTTNRAAIGRFAEGATRRAQIRGPGVAAPSLLMKNCLDQSPECQLS